jgi:L-seryl-tRNA(Ser) seleniumtransferase
VSASFRDLPAVHVLLADPAWEAACHVARHLRRAACRAVLDDARETLKAGGDVRLEDLAPSAVARAASDAQPVLVPVVNATGVLLHTNLGRAPLADVALEAIAASAGRYSNLEFDLDGGKRGSRHEHLGAAFARVLGCGDVLVTNNNAAAVFLALKALAGEGAGVVVSRGELVEIGGSFRMPDIMEASGASMVEVGATNRTHLADYERALDAGASVVMKVHQSNFAIVGFTKAVGLKELASAAHARDAILIYDLGSGLLRSREGLGDDCVLAALEQGADLVLFSGDKLLGGPQAGIVAGRSDLVQRLRSHPVMRLVRPGKLTLLALEATLRAWESEPEGSPVPVAELASRTAEELRVVADRLASSVASVVGDRADVDVVAAESTPGGGSSAVLELPSWAVRVRPLDGSEDGLAAVLRRGRPAVVGRLESGAVLLDVRSLLDGDEARIRDALLRW